MAALTGCLMVFSPLTEMIIPTFFSYDNFESYSNGSITSLTGGVVWQPGVFIEYTLDIPQDNFEEYDNGTVTVLDGGTDWLADGIFTTY
jgi:hypothetical protein